MPPENYLTTRKGVRKDLKGGIYEKNDKDEDSNDFQFYRKGEGRKILDACEEESFDRLFDLYLFFIIQRIHGSSRRGRKKRRENGVGRNHRHRHPLQ
jgi:hypothetical protein